MVYSLFFCATLTGNSGGHTPLVRAGSETSYTGTEQCCQSVMKKTPRIYLYNHINNNIIKGKLSIFFISEVCMKLQ